MLHNCTFIEGQPFIKINKNNFMKMHIINKTIYATDSF